MKPSAQAEGVQLSGKAGERPDWHALDADEALAALDTPHGGFAAEEAERRLAQYGPNRLPRGKERGALIRFLLQFHNLLIYVLIAAGALAAAIKAAGLRLQPRMDAVLRRLLGGA